MTMLSDYPKISGMTNIRTDDGTISGVLHSLTPFFDLVTRDYKLAVLVLSPSAAYSMFFFDSVSSLNLQQMYFMTDARP